MKINFVKEDPRVKAAHEEFIKQNPQFTPTEEDKKKDRRSFIGCYTFILPLIISMVYYFLTWLFDWREGIKALINQILFYGGFVLFYICILWQHIIKREKKISDMIYLLPFSALFFMLAAPTCYKALSDLITGDTKVDEGTFRLYGMRPPYIVFDSYPSSSRLYRRIITPETYERVKNAHIIRMVYWKRSGIVQSVEVISEKPVSNTGVE